MLRFSRSNHHQLGFLAVIAASLVLVALPFWFVVRHPNDYFFQAGGDGLQSYFATAFYAFHDHGLRFTGMNYPQGEHFLYPNLQPSIALVINWLQRCGIPAAAYTVAITNLLALVGLVLTPVVLYAILRRLSLPVAYSVLTALLIGLLSPQVIRMGGHMSLSYACFMPWLWYCIIRMREAPLRWRWYVIFGASTILQGLTMLYFLACGCFFLLAHVVVLAVQRRPWAVLWRLLLAALLPLLLFRGWIALTDPTTDRPPNPYGLLVYMTTLSGLLTPFTGPVSDFWRKYVPPSETIEAWSYIGVVAELALLGTVIRVLVLLWRRRWGRLLRPALPEALRSGLPAATLVLLLAMGFPFILPGAEGLVQYLGPLKQLRALGRFAWPFYYVVGVYAAYNLYALSRTWWRLSTLRWGIVAALLAVWAGEAWLNVDFMASGASRGFGAAAFLDPSQSVVPQLSWTKWKITDFQAILPLPYFNMGSDKFGLTGTPACTFQAEKLAVVSGLPLLASYVSRPSVGQVLAHVQLLSSPLLPKELLAGLPSQKPILLLVTPETITPAEQRLVALSTLVITTPEMSLYALPVAALAATVLPQERAVAAARLPQLSPRPGGYYCTTPKGVLVENFSGKPDRRGRLGAGAFYEPANAFSMLYDGPLPAPADTGRYELSVWMNAKMGYSLGNLQVVQYAAGQTLDHQLADAHVSTEVDGDWLRVAIIMRVKPGTDRLQVVYDNQDLLVDDLIIRPLDTDVYYYVKGPNGQRQLVKNGYRL